MSSSSAVLPRAKPTQTAHLRLSVRDAAQAIPQGNVFASVTSVSTGQVWRRLKWHGRTQSFSFPGLPLDLYRVAVWRTPSDRITFEIQLGSGECLHYVVLPAQQVRPRLEVSLKERSTARRRDFERGRLAHEGGDHLTASHFLSWLLNDSRVVSAATQSIESLSVDRPMWRFLGRAVPGPARTATPMHVARARFVLLTWAICMNAPTRRCLAQGIEADAMWATLLRVTNTMDKPELDDLLMLVAVAQFPATAHIEVFIRAWLERYDGLCNLRDATGRSPLGHLPRSEWPSVPAMVDEPSSPVPLTWPVEHTTLATAAAPLLAEAARILHDVVRSAAA